MNNRGIIQRVIPNNRNDKLYFFKKKNINRKKNNRKLLRKLFGIIGDVFFRKIKKKSENE